MQRECEKCHRPRPEKSFGSGRKGSVRRTCGSCRDRQRSPEGASAKVQRSARYQRKMRQENPGLAILQDARRIDKKLRRENDLEADFVRSAIRQPCDYCGETTLRMTLDRLDNSLGHTKANVLPACIRCNYARGNMPFEAWQFLVAGMRSAREAGAFGSWVGRLDPRRAKLGDPGGNRTLETGFADQPPHQRTGSKLL